MKKVFFKKMTVKNFLSIGKEPVTIIFEEGINLITGINLDKEDASNGSGKSSLVNALYFNLYGTALKDLKIDQIPNNYTTGPCEVMLDFEVQEPNSTSTYTVIRMLRPSKLKLLKNGQDITKSTIVKTSELLQAIISCNSTVFENSVVMDSNNATSFMSQKKIEKRKFLEGILNLGIFSEMLSQTKADYNKHKYDFDISSEKLKDCLQVMETYKAQSERIELYKQERQQTIESKISSYQQDINRLEKKLKVGITQDALDKIDIKITEIKQDSLDNKAKLSDLIKEQISLNQNKRFLDERYAKLMNTQDICLECDRSYTHEDKHVIEEKKKSVMGQLQAVNVNIARIKKSIAEIEGSQVEGELNISTLTEKYRSIKTIIDANENITWKINQIKNSIKDLETESQTVPVNDYIDILQKQTEVVEELTKQVNTLKIDLEVFQAVKFILSEEGVRSYIVKKILRILNSKINSYLRKLDANAKCEFNEYFEETLWDQYKNERSYHNFSSGEQRRIDLAILFAFQDIRKLQADIAMNISIYDELLDSSLDRKGAELVLSILKERAAKGKECVYIISHRKEAQTTSTSRVITLQKKNGITTLI